MTTRLHYNCRMALRAALATLVKATTGPVTGVSITTAGLVTRPSGSFLADGFSAGDEVVASGFGNAGNNQSLAVLSVTATTLRTVPAAATLVNETQVGAVTLKAGLPTAQSDENFKFSPPEPFPWFRESYKGGPETRQSIGPRAQVRLDGLYMLNVFYLAGSGSSGLDGMSDAIRGVLYPGALLSYGGQNLTIVSCSRTGAIPEDGWTTLPISVRFFAYSITP